MKKLLTLYFIFLIIKQDTLYYVKFVISDEIDILGYGSGQSDTDDHSSIESGSDGYTGAAKRLVLSSSSLDSL